MELALASARVEDNGDVPPPSSFLCTLRRLRPLSPRPSPPVSAPGRNLLARAKNGTGKTAAFCIPILQVVDPSKKAVQAMVLVPTRELAMQTTSVLKQLGKHLAIEVVSITGGNPLRDDILRLQSPKGVHILVGTPGRIKDLAERKVARLERCALIALDEADKLLAPEFSVVIEEMLATCFPKDKTQILLFSATFPQAVVGFRDKWMPSPYEINLMEVRHRVYGVMDGVCRSLIFSHPTPSPLCVSGADAQGRCPVLCLR